MDFVLSGNVMAMIWQVRRESFRFRKIHMIQTLLGIVCMSLLLNETEGSGMIEKLVRRGNSSFNGTLAKSNAPVPDHAPAPSPSQSSNSVQQVKHSSKFTSKPSTSSGNDSHLIPNPTNKVTSTTSVSSSVSIKSTTSPRPSLRSQDATDTNEKQSHQKREILLPLEKLFPTVSSKTEPATGSNSNPKTFESMKMTRPTPSPEEKLRSALLNHSLHINDMDKDLDHLVFSQLPEGSKLILKSVKIVRTDEDGNDQDDGNEATTWDIVVNNGTNDDFLSDEDLYETTEFADLISAGSHPKTRAQYDSHGSNVRTKQKDTKYHNNRNHGKHNAQTFTDTEGTKVKNYEGTEKGLTDFANANGNSQSNEGGRFKDSKKKNKGRKVTGFKRVYHKEEFQRTEHFYDDEEAKRIAENFGANDAKEKSAHGLKNDDRKYHGTYKEHTDGQKVKNEHGTTNDFNKGHHETHKDSERHHQAQHHAASTRPGHAGSNYAQTANANAHRRPQHHDNQKYHGAYSTNTDSKIKTPAPPSPDPESTDTEDDDEESAPSAPVTSQEVIVNVKPIGKGQTRQRNPSGPKNSRQKQIKASASTHDNSAFPSVTMSPPQPLLAKPSEMKVFFSPRERYIPYYSKDDATMAYAPNFGPNTVKTSHSHPQVSSTSISIKNPMSYGYSYRTIHPNPSKDLYGGSKGRNDTDSYSENSQNPRYAINYATGGKGNSHGHDDLVPLMYSTIVKTLPGQYELYNGTRPKGNLISIQKANGREVSSSSISSSQSNDVDSMPVPSTASASKGEGHRHGQGNPNQKLRQQQQHQQQQQQHQQHQEQIKWVPLGQSSNNNNNNNNNNNQYPPHYPGPLGDSRPNNGPKYPPTNLPLNHLRIGKTLIPTMYLRHPSTTVPVTNRRPGPIPVHGHGPQAYNNPPSQPSTVSYNAVRKNPQFSHFMNGLMDSVAGFFGRIG